jgi:hypothetical protein
MENLIKDSVSNMVDEQETLIHNVQTKQTADAFITYQQLLIENGILQDYLEVFGSMEDK